MFFSSGRCLNLCRNCGCNCGLSLSSLRKATLCGSSPQPVCLLTQPLCFPTVAEYLTCTHTHTQVSICKKKKKYLQQIPGSVNTGDLWLCCKTVLFKPTELVEQRGHYWLEVWGVTRKYTLLILFAFFKCYIAPFSLHRGWEVNKNQAGCLVFVILSVWWWMSLVKEF